MSRRTGESAAYADASAIGEPERTLVCAERGFDLCPESIDAERLVVEPVPAQRLVVALALEQPNEPVGIASFLAEHGYLDAVLELLAGDHSAEVLAFVPVLHSFGNDDRGGGVA